MMNLKPNKYLKSSFVNNIEHYQHLAYFQPKLSVDNICTLHIVFIELKLYQQLH